MPHPSARDRRLNQRSAANYSIDRLEFVGIGEAGLVGRVASAQSDFAAATTRTLDLLAAGRTADAQRAKAIDVTPLADRLAFLTDDLVNRAQEEVVQVVGDTRDAYARSQVIVLGFASASLVLALLLGLAIALSIIGPCARSARAGRMPKAIHWAPAGREP